MNVTTDLIVLYVGDVAASATFYSGLFGRKPVDQTPGFALFALDGGMKLGLFLRQVVQPQTSITGGGCELVVMTGSRDQVDAIIADWRKRNIVIGADAADAPFGYTAVALDPDQHRIRVLFDPQA